jgi:hypothetical protein
MIHYNLHEDQWRGEKLTNNILMLQGGDFGPGCSRQYPHAERSHIPKEAIQKDVVEEVPTMSRNMAAIVSHNYFSHRLRVFS